MRLFHALGGASSPDRSPMMSCSNTGPRIFTSAFGSASVSGERQIICRMIWKPAMSDSIKAARCGAKSPHSKPQRSAFDGDSQSARAIPDFIVRLMAIFKPELREITISLGRKNLHIRMFGACKAVELIQFDVTDRDQEQYLGPHLYVQVPALSAWPRGASASHRSRLPVPALSVIPAG
jgi:hypothetical protein